MDIEQAVRQLQIDVAVIRADLDNHITALGSDIKCVGADVRNMRDKIDRLFESFSKAYRNGNGKVWVVSGWAFGLLVLVLQYLLNR